ncbi:hypothetical protein ACHAW5_004039 [Stephanodiscus triporus]|uniref:Uncharacterized protein n=1 Tax=Stephanodiscus triporus TaxID=2934178 RepID=A0ABD3Q865_9STRA
MMNNLLQKSSSNKEKLRRHEEEKENDFLLGRAPRIEMPSASPVASIGADERQTTRRTPAPRTSLLASTSDGFPDSLNSQYSHGSNLPPPRTPPATTGNINVEGEDSSMSQEEIDKLEKYRLKAGRRTKPQYDILSMPTSAIDDQKMGHSRHQVTDRKQRVKSKDNARLDKETKDGMRFSMAGDDNVQSNDELKERQRLKRELDEQDRRLKDTILRQKTADGEIGCRSDESEDISSSSLKRDDTNQKHAMINRRDRYEEEQRIKERVRIELRKMPQGSEMNSVASGVGNRAEIGATTCNTRNISNDKLEKRRLHQRKGDGEDHRLNETVRKTSDAVKMPQLINDDVGNEFEREFERLCHLRALQRKGTRKKIRRKAVFDKSLPDLKENSLFKAASHQEGGGRTLIREEINGKKVDNNSQERYSSSAQNLLDMHLAQFRVSHSHHYEEEILVDENYSDDFIEGETKTPREIQSWHQKYTLKKALELAQRTPVMDWLSSFYRCDPRWQILKFFNEVAREGGDAQMDENLAASPLANLFCKANVFTVWRPTSNEAIKNMMLGIATGKGLDIKGKSAKRGNISSYVPFIQIYEDPHKEHARAFIKEGKMLRVFYRSEFARNEAHEVLLDIKDYMMFAAKDAFHVLSNEYADPSEQELAMKHLMYDDSSMNVEFVDTYVSTSHPVFGLDISEYLFWESYVMMQDLSRPEGSDWDIGRKSELTFMDMNFKSLRLIPAPGEPRAVVYQMSMNSPMEPRMLLMAYEEHGRVKPVVSDFDCFLLGSRGVRYNDPIPTDQVELVRWTVKNIGEVLDKRAASNSKEGWMDAWFKVLKSAALKGYYPKTPKYGNGDPKSYEIIEVAVSRLKETGCVRHGAECFNWFFPQEIDDEYLVISDTLPGNVKWKKVNVQELQDLLITKIEEGFTFPINLKWVMCDPGWRRVYDALLASKKANVQDSINCWLPPGTGLREEIDWISARHPRGFEATNERTEGDESMAQKLDDFERYLKMQRAWRKLRLLLFWIRFVNEKRLEREDREMGTQ